MKTSVILYVLLQTNALLVYVLCQPDSTADNDEYDIYAGVYDKKYDVMEETDKLFESTFGSQYSDKSFSGDLLETFEKMLDSFEDPASTSEEECVYRCSSGLKPVKRGGYVPVSKGCGPKLGLIKVNLISTGYKGLEKCCDTHDICYGTCNKVRKECDDKLKECMLQYCTTDTEIKDEVHGKAPGICKYVAETMHMGVESFGCDAFIESQSKACECPKTDL